MFLQCTYVTYSDDLYNWETPTLAYPPEPWHEGANVIYWQNRYWMIVDEDCVFALVSDDGVNWEMDRAEEYAFTPDDHYSWQFGKVIGANHCDIVVQDGRAFMLYFLHPNNTNKTEVRMAELHLDEEGHIYVDPEEEAEYFLHAPDVTEIWLKSVPHRQTYEVGDTLDLKGLKIGVRFTDGMSDTLAVEDLEKYGITVSIDSHVLLGKFLPARQGRRRKRHDLFCRRPRAGDRGCRSR